MIEHHSQQVSRTAHYYTMGTLTPETSYIWLVCHGYGQPADEFIRKFDKLDLTKNFFIAPEGFSRFYWGGVQGKIVASWMTSKDRLSEISDYTEFIHSLLQSTNALEHQAKWLMFGFSQGCATVVRYLHAYRPDFSRLVLWAGAFPHDLDYGTFASYLNRREVDLIVGDQDQYISADYRETEIAFMREQKIRARWTLFDGRHRIDREVLQQFCDRIYSHEI